MKQSIIALVICTIKIFIMGNSAKETFSNFWKQQLANHLLFLITCFINKLTEWQWVLLWVPPLQKHFYAIMIKNVWIIVESTLSLRYTNGMLMIFLFFFPSKEHLQLSVDYINKQHKCIKFTSEVITLSRF